MSRASQSLTDLAPPPLELREVARRLREAELPHPPPARAEPEPLNALIRTILSQQNTSAVARRQYEALRLAYPRWEAALTDGPDGIEKTLKAAGGGLSRIKAGYIYGVLAALEERQGKLSLRETRALSDTQARALLESLPGVGMKTASLILLFDLIRPAIPVDSNIERLAKRLEWVPQRWNAEKVERWFDLVLPHEWAFRQAFHLAGVRHGRNTCRARHPRCDLCVLRELCPLTALLSPVSPLSPVSSEK